MFFGKEKKELDYNYKFRDLKFYCSKEWMYGSAKKYRNVFNSSEVSYLYVEFSFFNKLFDEEDWNANVSIKYIDKESKKELCNLNEKYQIKKEDNVFYIRNSWGKEEKGAFWQKGSYKCEAYIDNNLVAEKDFFIENFPEITIKNNPCFDLIHVKLYEGDYSGNPKNNVKKYYSVFKTSDTRYIWVELKVKSKVNYAWNCEFFYNFYNDTGDLKGHSKSLDSMEAGKAGTNYTFERGWGNKEPGSWIDTDYRLDVVFMDVVVASVPFRTGAEFVEGELQVSKSIESSSIIDNEKEESLEQVIEKLNSLIGLNNIKKQINEHIEYLKFLKIRKEKGFNESSKISLHSVFTGNPGTGKTTVVNLLGKIYKKIGLLSTGIVYEVDRASLVAEYIGQTAPKVKKEIDKARGGILFIDEAYSLSRNEEDSKDYGKEVIEILLKEMSDGIGDIAIMVAGYPREMDIFLNTNPGLKSRFNYYFNFEDYKPDELLQIVNFSAKKKDVVFETDAITQVNEIIIERYRNRDRTFGNARFANSLVEEAKINMGIRLMKEKNVKNLSKEQLSTITIEDVILLIESKSSNNLNIKIDEVLLKESLEELNQLVGINEVKKEINELIKLTKYYIEIGRDTTNKISIHSIFTGNPGTGKTTVARLLGKIYKALGLLEKGHIVECDREALVAGYIGQTAIKTKAVIDSAVNGVLFIDEAYALAEGGDNDFGKEAIEILLKNMEDLRGRISVIVAGYPDNMHKFINSNPGLKSRFDKTILFSDYNAEDLFKIFLMFMQKDQMQLESSAKDKLVEYITKLTLSKDKHFGNARNIRTLYESVTKNQNLRMADMPKENRTTEMLNTFTLIDIPELEIMIKENKQIGFKK